jgi:hypothetical protein
MVLLLGCASDPPRYPEDHRRFERIVEAVETLRTAYIQHDDQATESLLLPLDTLEIWAQGVRKDFQTYSDITLDLSIERIAINGDSISVFVSWQGVWKRPTEDFGLKARGNGILHWTGRQVILLSRVEGDLPFGMADRQALS